MDCEVLHIVCFETFSVKHKENDLYKKYMHFGYFLGPWTMRNVTWWHCVLKGCLEIGLLLQNQLELLYSLHKERGVGPPFHKIFIIYPRNLF